MEESHLVATLSVEARLADASDLDVLEGLYRGLEKEMTALHAMWTLADGLDEPVSESLRHALEDPDTIVVMGDIEGYPVGFVVARVEGMLSHAGEDRIGAIRLIYVDHEAREVAVGETMRDLAMALLRKRGITKFDAHVLPGHRLVKNFFEAGGFSARSIVMHHDDERE